MSISAVKRTNRGVSAPSLNAVLPASVATLLIVLFLFFIDEGYYDFRWMRDAGNWLMFAVYLAFVFPMQWLLAGMLGRLSGKQGSLLVVTLLTLVADSFILGLVFLVL